MQRTILIIACLSFALPIYAADAGRIEVRALSLEFSPEVYREKGEVGFIVEARDDTGPVENLDKATWSLLYQEREVEAIPAVRGFRSEGLISSVLVLIPATSNFSGFEEPDTAKERSEPPLKWVLDGLQTLKTSFGSKDLVLYACYDEVKANLTAFGAARTDAAVPTFDQVRDKCYNPEAASAQPRLQTLFSSAIKTWLTKRKQDVQRFVVIIITDGSSKENISEYWWKPLQNDLGNLGWLELYVIGYEDGGEPAKIQALAKGGTLFSATVRQNLVEEIPRIGPLVGGTGLYKVNFSVTERIQGQNVEFALLARDSRGTFRSVAFPMGQLQRKSSWVRIVVLVAAILVGLAFFVLLTRFIVAAVVAKRKRRAEEEAARQAQRYEGPSRGRLIVRDGPAAGTTFYLVEDLTYIGRAPDNHIILPDPSVGKRHASIRIQQKTYQLEDLQSVNGVFVNGQKILKVHLKDGDSIRLGSSEMQFRIN